MSLEDQVRWDRQHGQNAGHEKPAVFLTEIFTCHSWDIPPGQALDIACGAGRNALYLAERGFGITAIDISPVGLERGAQRAKERSLSIRWQRADLETLELPQAAYDVILDIDYLQRGLVPAMKAALKPGGFIIFETFLVDQQAIGQPKNPHYLLAHNELLAHFRDFRVLYYREGKFADGGEPSFRAGILAQRPG